MNFNVSQIREITEQLLNKKIGVIPTDTIYGISCLALDTKLLNRVYEIKDRPTDMPLITVIPNVKSLDLFGLSITDFDREQMAKFWPGPNTLIFKDNSGTKRSFRIPDNNFLQSILEVTGPLISTSANLHGKPASTNINQAIEYFGDKIDFYVDGGDLNNPPSSIFDLTSGELIKIR